MENKQIIDIEYKGFKICYREDFENYACQIADNKPFEKQTLKECKKRIDDFIKKENNFERIKVIKKDYRRFVKGEITSMIDDEKKPACWFVSEKKERSKEYLEDLFFDNDSNNKVLQQYLLQEQEIKQQEEKLRIILMKFKKLNKEEK